MPAKSPAKSKEVILSVSEFGLSRLIDSVLAFMLIWLLPLEFLGMVEVVQALIAPLLFAFLSAEPLLYRHFSEWKTESIESFQTRVAALRLFCWIKGLGGLVFSVLITLVWPSQSHTATFYALIWAFSRTLGPQVIAVDREFMRLDGRFGSALMINLGQKLILIVGLLLATHQQGSSILPVLAGAGALSVVASAILSRFLNHKIRFHGGYQKTAKQTLRAIFKEFTIWNHFNYVLSIWTQTLDMFWLGVLHVPLRAAGIYSAALKVANFSFALPLAVSTFFSVRLSRAAPDAPERRDWRRVGRPTLALGGVAILQAAAVMAAAQLLAFLFSRGRWAPDEISDFVKYLRWIECGTAVYCFSFFAVSWINICASVRDFFWRVMAPWTLGSGLVYLLAYLNYGMFGLAVANLPVYFGFLALLAAFLYSLPNKPVNHA